MAARKEKQASSTKETSERSCETEWNGQEKDEIKEEANKKKIQRTRKREKKREREKRGEKRNIREHGKNYENKVKWAKRTTERGTLREVEGLKEESVGGGCSQANVRQRLPAHSEVYYGFRGIMPISRGSPEFTPD